MDGLYVAYRVPYMEDGDVTMGDSLTMILYILERYGEHLFCTEACPTRFQITLLCNPFDNVYLSTLYQQYEGYQLGTRRCRA